LIFEEQHSIPFSWVFVNLEALNAPICYHLHMTDGYDNKLTLKAERREVKKRPRMKVSGASLRAPSKHAGMAIAKKPRKKK
jgi:hypothetical protein